MCSGHDSVHACCHIFSARNERIIIMDIKDTTKIKTKDEARQFAIDWQTWTSEQNLSYGELAEWEDVFTKLGRQFFLTAEFKENCIL